MFSPGRPRAGLGMVGLAAQDWLAAKIRGSFCLSRGWLVSPGDVLLPLASQVGDELTPGSLGQVKSREITLGVVIRVIPEDTGLGEADAEDRLDRALMALREVLAGFPVGDGGLGDAKLPGQVLLRHPQNLAAFPDPGPDITSGHGLNHRY